MLYESYINTPIGEMIAIADDAYLYLLEFKDCKNLDWEIDFLKKHTKLDIIEGMTKPLESIRKEIDLYFQAHLKEFRTPIKLIGTNFQKQVWQALRDIPFNKQQSYYSQALSIGKPKSYRAVAGANGANKLAIIVPCHRIINKDGRLGGYKGGLDRKRWLLEFECKPSICISAKPF